MPNFHTSHLERPFRVTLINNIGVYIILINAKNPYITFDALKNEYYLFL